MTEEVMDYIQSDVEAAAEVFKIDNDNTADWALGKIKEEESERDRLVSIAESKIFELQMQIKDLNEKCDNSTRFLKSRLAEYFETVPHKTTKTQESYKLLSGSLVMKKASQKIIHDDKALLDYLGSDPAYVEMKRSVKWAEFKKSLEVTDGKVINMVTGEVVEACSIEDVPASFNIKF